MPALFAGLLNNVIFKPVLRPILRLISGLVAIPLFRFLLKRIFKVKANDAEMERDLEMWFRGAVLLLAATKNFEDFVFRCLSWETEHHIVWQTMLPRLLLAVGVIESMPDEDVFSILHRGPPKLKLTTRAGLADAWHRRGEVLRGLAILHLRRSSPVFVILAVVFGNDPGRPEFVVGWWCYSFAVAQYLIIAFITQRGRIAGLLESFDRKASALRHEIVTGKASAAPRPARYD